MALDNGTCLRLIRIGADAAPTGTRGHRSGNMTRVTLGRHDEARPNDCDERVGTVPKRLELDVEVRDRLVRCGGYEIKNREQRRTPALARTRCTDAQDG